MKNFKKFVEEKDNALGDMSYSGVSPNEVLVRIAKIAVDDNLRELLGFYENLAKKNTKIRNELNSYKQDMSSGIHKRIPKEHMPIQDDGKDIVMKPTADGFGSPTEDAN